MNSDDLSQTVPLIEEVASLEKHIHTTGRVRVRTVLQTDTHGLEASLSVQSVNVERISIDKRVEIPPPVRKEGNVTVVPIIEERLVVEKQLFLIEEIRITVTESKEEVDIPVELRKQRAVIEQE